MPSLFTSESVTEGHPDKLADQISDAILDAILAKDPLARVACEAIVTTGLVIVVGEITTDCYVDIPRIIRQTVREVGYTRAKYGFDAETCGVVSSIDEQSPDIAQGRDARADATADHARASPSAQARRRSTQQDADLPAPRRKGPGDRALLRRRQARGRRQRRRLDAAPRRGRCRPAAQRHHATCDRRCHPQPDAQ